MFLVYRRKFVKNFNKYVSCKCKCKFAGRKCTSKSGIKGRMMINVDVNVKNISVKKIIFGILLNVVAKMVNI